MFKWMYEKAAKDAVELVDKKIGPAEKLLNDSDARMTAGIIITSLGAGFIMSALIKGKE